MTAAFCEAIFSPANLPPSHSRFFRVALKLDLRASNNISLNTDPFSQITERFTDASIGNNLSSKAPSDRL